MLISLTELAQTISLNLIRAMTGNLLSDEQIRKISSNVVGSYFADFLPRTKSEVAAAEKVDQARLHITEAANIISSLQVDLENQAEQLDKIVTDIEEKKKVADRYSTLVQTNEKTMAAIRAEMEEVFRHELTAQNQRGKRLRLVTNFVVWVFTLVLGAYLPQIVQYVRAHL